MTFFDKAKTLALGALVATAGFSSAMAEEFELKLHHFLGAKSPARANMLAPWAERIMEASDGRIKIEIFPSMTLGGKPPQLPRQVRDGVVDIVWMVNAYAAGAFPRSEVFDLPGVHQGDIGAVNLAIREMYDDYLADDYKGIVPLFQHVHGGQAFHMASEPVRSPADFVGKKIRIPSRTGSWVLEALGASPIKTSVGEIPVALSKKVIDGALIPFEIIPPLKIHEQTAYQIEGPGGKRMGNTTFSVAMNKDRWDSLPADLQQIFIDQSGPEWLVEVGEVWTAGETGGIKMAVEGGNEHIQLTEEEWAAFETAVEPVVDRWIAEMNSKGIDGQALYDKAVETVAKHSATN